MASPQPRKVLQGKKYFQLSYSSEGTDFSILFLDFISGSIKGVEINCLYKGPMSKAVLPQEIRQISEGSPGTHTDQSHQNQLYKRTNIHMSVTFNLHSNACSTILGTSNVDGVLVVQRSNLHYSYKVYMLKISFLKHSLGGLVCLDLENAY